MWLRIGYLLANSYILGVTNFNVLCIDSFTKPCYTTVYQLHFYN
jgi:hypothetical protein